MIERNAPAKGVAMTRVAYIERATAEDGRRLVRFVASDETVDRYGDIIRASGWQLDNYRRNPQLLYNHDTSILPLGRVEPIAVEGNSLIAHANFSPAGRTAFTDSVWQLIGDGALNAVSVGFMPLDDPTPIFNADKQLTGFEFVAQELLELSVVAVPANPNALAIAKQFNLTPEERMALFAPPDTAALVAAQTRATRINDLRYRRPIV
jgi:HK97 family phage prohead protease